jgi:hypothetical protein
LPYFLLRSWISPSHLSSSSSAFYTEGVFLLELMRRKYLETPGKVSSISAAQHKQRQNQSETYAPDIGLTQRSATDEACPS